MSAADVPSMSGAHAAVTSAIKDGRLRHADACEACGSVQRYAIIARAGKMERRATVVWHHWSYLPMHWLDVIGLCTACHRRLHAGLIPEPRTGRVYQPPPSQAAPPAELPPWRFVHAYATRAAAREATLMLACDGRDARIVHTEGRFVVEDRTWPDVVAHGVLAADVSEAA